MPTELTGIPSAGSPVSENKSSETVRKVLHTLRTEASKPLEYILANGIRVYKNGRFEKALTQELTDVACPA